MSAFADEITPSESPGLIDIALQGVCKALSIDTVSYKQLENIGMLIAGNKAIVPSGWDVLEHHPSFESLEQTHAYLSNAAINCLQITQSYKPEIHSDTRLYTDVRYQINDTESFRIRVNSLITNPRPLQIGTEQEALKKLRGAYKREHTISSTNDSQITSGYIITIQKESLGQENSTYTDDSTLTFIIRQKEGNPSIPNSEISSIISGIINELSTYSPSIIKTPIKVISKYRTGLEVFVDGRRLAYFAYDHDTTDFPLDTIIDNYEGKPIINFDSLSLIRYNKLESQRKPGIFNIELEINKKHPFVFEFGGARKLLDQILTQELPPKP